MSILIPSADSKSKTKVLRNRRASVRYQCAPATPGKICVGDCTEYQRVWVIDLALGGAGLLMSRPLECDTALIVRLHGLASQNVYDLPAHVVHANQQSDGDWLVGCQFTDKLSREQLDDLL